MSQMMSSTFSRPTSSGNSFAIPVYATLALLSLGTLCFASVNVAVTPAIGDGAPVGTTIPLNASAVDTTNPNATFTYQFNIGLSGHPLQVVRDFYTFNSFPWTPSNSEGIYDIQVMVHSSTGATGIGNAVYQVTARATSSPVISHTNHPLVALYSMPVCTAGHTARVRFKLPSDTVWQATPRETCNGTTTLNFYVGGMRANTTYQIQHDLFNGPFDTPGPILTFTTGSIPGGTVAGYSLVKAFPAPNNTGYPVLLNGAVGTAVYATDTTGALIWYLNPPGVGVTYFDRPVNGGTFLVQTTDGSSSGTKACGSGNSGSRSCLLREYDMAGNIVRETNVLALNMELAKLPGPPDPVISLHHEALRLADGSTAILAGVEHFENQGAGNVDVIGDQALVLDSNFQVKWWWNEFHHFPISRPAVLGETCAAAQGGCADPLNAATANDWTHSNAIWQWPDGNLIVSSRHQDWIVKIPYENGAGPKDGAIIWTLGADGAAALEGRSFSVNSSDPSPWFSHQHDAEFQSQNGLMTVFDNGNTRVSKNPGEHSRAQGWSVDETNMVATLSVNIDLGQFSLATGSVQLLSNGNYTADLGVINNASSSSTHEYAPSGSGWALQSQEDSSKISYRSFRMRSLYQEH